MTRAYNTATTQQNTGGAVSPFVAGKNAIINGDFFVNQRNFTSITASSTYGFDRWFIGFSGGTVTYSAQTFTLGTAPVAGYEGTNFARVITASQSATGDFAYLQQRIENVKTFAGQTVTVSFWAKASTGTPNVGVVLEQQFGTGGSGTVVTSGGTTAISTSWVRYSKTISVPSIAGKTIGTGTVALNLGLMTSVGTTISNAGYPAVGVQNATIDFWGVQVEAGSVATAFQTATGTIQGELAACQRYYYRTTSAANSNPNYTLFSTGFATSTTQILATVNLPVSMRIAPTALDTSAMSTFYSEGGTTWNTPTSISLGGSTQNDLGQIVVVKTSFTSGANYLIFSNNTTTAFLGFTAEL